MNKNLLLALALCAAPALAHEGHEHHAALNPAWDKLKALQGDWVSKDGAKVNYKLVSGDTALMETMAMPNGGSMITMYSPDGDGVLMTHYCASGTQPRMRAEGITKEATVEFKLKDVSNQKSPDQEIMNGLVLAFPGEGRMDAVWSSKAGKKKPELVKFEYRRK